MTTKHAFLEYCVSPTNTRSGSGWRFRFKTPDDRTLMESIRFDSRAKAEAAFLAMTKFLATNQYTIHWRTTPGEHETVRS